MHNEVKETDLHLFDGVVQVTDLALYRLLVGQDEVDLLGDLVLEEAQRC